MRLQPLVVRELRKQRRCVSLRAMNVNVNVNMNVNMNINVNEYNRGGDFEGLKLKM